MTRSQDGTMIGYSAGSFTGTRTWKDWNNKADLQFLPIPDDEENDGT